MTTLSWRSALARSEKLPTWLLGGLAALFAWKIGMFPPAPGLDGSWNAGLAMAAEQSLQYGREVVFTYGPLGFLQSQSLWFADLGVVSFFYSASLFAGFCVTAVWLLRQKIPAVAATVIVFLIVAILPLLELGLLIAAMTSLWMVSAERSQRTVNLFIVAGASFSAVEGLVKLSTGPLFAVIFFIALVGIRAKRWQLAAFVGIYVAELLAFWLITGQSLGDIPAFLGHTIEIVSGYSTAMLATVDVPAWKVLVATVSAAVITLIIVAASSLGSYRDRRARWAGIAIVAVAGFIFYKEGVVRTDAGHLSLYFSSTCVLWLAIPWARSRWPLMLAGAAVIAAIGVPVRPESVPISVHPIANVKLAWEQVENLADSSRRDKEVAEGRHNLKSTYKLDPKTRAALEGHSVAIEPWEIATAWAYEMDWSPLPVFQNYQAYTTGLDELNADEVESADGPERLLRENEPLVNPEFPGTDIDNRFTAWDPPAQARAVLCNFDAIRTTERWQVLGRVPNRCGAPRLVGSAEAGEGESVDVPTPAPDEAIFVRIGGAGVGGIEKITNFFLHAKTRHLTVNDSFTYRLLPETAGDGLLLRAGTPTSDEGVFSPFPEARTIAVSGAGDDLSYDFYAMKVSGLTR